MNLLGMTALFGINSSLDTLVSQAAGAKDLQMCGVYLNRGRFASYRIVMTVLFIPIAVLSF